MKNANHPNLWQPQHIRQHHTLELSLGALRLWIHRGGQEWHIAHETLAGNEPLFAISMKEAPFPQQRNWTRWIQQGQRDTLVFQPRMPDRPLVVRPEMPMCLMPKQAVQFFIGIPIWLAIRFEAEGSDAIQLPTQSLSNSWFGSVTEGELCYAMKTTAKRRHQDLLPHAHRAVFPFEIRNMSTEKLNFERLCLRVQHLNIYGRATRLWTNMGRVSYRGEDKWSRIVYAREAPDFDPPATLLSDAREKLARGTFLHTFDNLKQLAEF